MANEFPQAAWDTLIERVYAPVFFTKLASLGVVPNTQAERQVYVDVAATLREAREKEQPQDGVNPLLKEAADNLQALVNNQPAVPAQHRQQVKQAAAGVLGDKDVYQAAIDFGNHLASVAAQAQQTA